MPYIQHLFKGGWATAFGAAALNVVPDQNGVVSVPFLTAAENVWFDLSGALKLRPEGSFVGDSVSGRETETLLFVSVPMSHASLKSHWCKMEVR